MPSSTRATYIYRITHVENLPWIAANGLHCRNSNKQDPSFRTIGIQNLIDKRGEWAVPIAPGGTLGDYIPFYFTSRSPMLYNLKTGRNVNKLPMTEIAIIVTSIERLWSARVPFLFTDRHAKLATARFSSDMNDLEWIDWDIISRSDFRYDVDDPGKIERYQAEALVYRYCDFSHIEAIIVSDPGVQVDFESRIASVAGPIKVVVSRRHFF